MIKKVKNTVPWTYVISNLNGEETVGTFYERELQKTNQNKFRVEKVIKRKGNNQYVKCKGYDNFLTVGLIKRHIMSEYIPEPKSFGRGVEVE